MTQRRLELLTEEFEEMGQTKLFTPLECREIKKRCRDFECKINGTPNLQDFKDYIACKTSVFNDLRTRRSKSLAGSKNGSLEHRIMNRIKTLYETAIHKFSDFQFCLAFLEFCKQANYVQSIFAIVQNILKNYPENPKAWHIAARWYAYDRGDVTTAVQTACKGLALHKDSTLLYNEVIELELLHALGNNWCKDSSSLEPMTEKQTTCAEKLQTFIKEMISNITDCSYFIKTLHSLENYKFTFVAQNLIIDYLLKVHSHEVEVWHILAQREFKGLFFPSGQNIPSGQNSTTKTKLIRCCEKYKEGLERIPKSKKGVLWSLYLDCLISQLEDDFGCSKEFKTNTLLSAYEQAFQDDHLSEKHFISWLERAGSNMTLQILDRGIMVYPDSVELWHLRLKYEIVRDNPKAIEDIFREGIKHLKHRSVELWNARLRYHLLSSNDETIDCVYREAIGQPAEISDVLKPRYLDWLTFTKGIEAARVQYLKIANEKPYCKTLHLSMSRLESNELHCNFGAWEQVLKTACKQFGKDDVEVWINYIEFYSRFKKRNCHNFVQQVYNEAKSNLPEVLFLVFEDAYNSINV